MSPKLNLIIHAIGQMAGQALVMNEFSDPLAKAVLQLVVAIVGVVVAFRDQSISKTKNGNQQ